MDEIKMLYSLILVTMLSSNVVNEQLITENLTRSECVALMVEISKSDKTATSEIICRNEQFTLVI